MGTELIGPFVKEDSTEVPPIPPGFESLASINLKKAEDNQFSSSSSAVLVDSVSCMMETVSDLKDSTMMNPLRRRRGIKYSPFDTCSGDEYESEQISVSRHRLPKGVIRGCETCSNCQKVIAKWHPEEARKLELKEAPVFYPSEEEFEDTLKYISSIRAQAEMYGICRIVPPPSWKPPCPLKEKNVWEASKFTTRVQRIDKLQKRNSMRQMQINYNKKRKRRGCMKNGVDGQNSNEEIEIASEVAVDEAERFGFEPGPDFTLDEFQKYADYFKIQYFNKNLNKSEAIGNRDILEHWEPSLEEIEGEYWRMVERPTEEIEVLYGADVETGEFGSGFPKHAQQVQSDSDTKYSNSGWNLNNFPRLPGSVLSFESSDISGVVVPWLYVGMCFSSFCWHVEDHHLYSLNYMHWGAPKMWYGVSGSDAVKLEAAMRKHLPDLFEEQPDLLHKLVTQLSPSILKSDGIPVYRCVQNPGEFVLTFPRAYHAGFNCGFNCAEAVNVAPVDWLLHGQNAIDLYRQQCRKTSISHDKLLLGAAREAVKANWECNLLRKFTSNNLRWKDVCGKDGVLSKALKSRVEMERVHRDFLCKSSQSLKMESSFDANSERECSVCLFDLHLSAAGCYHCSPDKYACLNHAKQLCSCSWGAKFYLFRYEINELNILVEALEGKLSAVYRWARLDLGLALSSYVSKDNMQVPVPVVQGKSSRTSQALNQKHSSLPIAVSVAGGSSNSSKPIVSSSSSQSLSPPTVVLALGNAKASVTLSSTKIEAVNHSSPSKNVVSSHETPVKEFLASNQSKCNKSLLSAEKDPIFVSDDGKDESNEELSVGKANSKEHTGHVQTHACPGSVVGMVNTSKNSSSSSQAVAVPSLMPEVRNPSSLRIKVEKGFGSDPSESICFKIPMDSANDLLWEKESPTNDDQNRDADHKSQQMDAVKSCNEDGDRIAELDADSRSMQNAQTVSCSSPGPHNSLDRYYRQKGPRIAKVIRRINCNVQPLDFGSVHAGKSWCDGRAIYPKGFRSRVRYIDVLDPTNMCHYISEILDVERNGPLFMVSLEHNTSEVFVHVSALKCWEMVRERVNQEISKQHKLGKPNLPPLQPPGSLDGMEMFGFSSPAIVQVIQAMDQQRVCSEYWKSRPLMQCAPSNIKTVVKSEPVTDQERCSGVEEVIGGLLKKANPGELHTLYSLLRKNSSDDLSVLVRLLTKEIDKNQT